MALRLVLVFAGVLCLGEAMAPMHRALGALEAIRQVKPDSYFAVPDSEWEQIINYVIHVESRGDAKCVNEAEWAVGLMQIRRYAREEVNRHTGKQYTYFDLFDADINRWVGSYYLTNVLYRHRYGNHVVKAVGAYNIGSVKIAEGWYPAAYLQRVIPWYWANFKVGRVISESRTNSYGQHLVRFANVP